MSKSKWADEVEKFLASSESERKRWLAAILLALTVLARETYDPHSTGLLQPQRLRKFNELIHRLATQLRDKEAGYSGMPDATFADMMTEAIEELQIKPDSVLNILR